METTESYDIVFLNTYVNSKGNTMYKYQVQGSDFTSYKLSQGSYYKEFEGKPLFYTKHNLGKKHSIYHSLSRGLSSEEYIGGYFPYKGCCPDCRSYVNLKFGPVENERVTILCEKCDPIKYMMQD